MRKPMKFDSGLMYSTGTLDVLRLIEIISVVSQMKHAERHAGINISPFCVHFMHCLKNINKDNKIWLEFRVQQGIPKRYESNLIGSS
jgi:hypothetical protein